MDGRVSDGVREASVGTRPFRRRIVSQQGQWPERLANLVSMGQGGQNWRDGDQFLDERLLLFSLLEVLPDGLKRVMRFPAGLGDGLPSARFDLRCLVLFGLQFVVIQRLVDACVFGVGGGHVELFGQRIKLGQNLVHIAGTGAGFKQRGADLTLAFGQRAAALAQDLMVQPEHALVVLN